MKIFRTLGAIACVIMIVSAFLPWIRIELIHDTYTGMYTGKDNFYGKPGYINIFFSGLFFILIFVNRVWAKRLNIFFGALLAAWTIRNVLVFTHCEMGYCPQKLIGIYLVILAAIFILLAALLPYMPEKKVD